MARQTKKSQAPEPETGPLYVGLTPNQIVAYNLARAREWKGWTQEQAAEALEPYLGKRWSTASFSQAERSIAGKVNRNFDADELVAFARAFDVPIGWFFMPPPPWTDQPPATVKLTTPDAKHLGTALATLVDLVFGDENGQALLALRLQEWLQERPPQLTAAQQQVTSLGRHRVEALARHSINDLAQWQTALRAMANHLEDLETGAKRTIADELGLHDL